MTKKSQNKELWLKLFFSYGLGRNLILKLIKHFGSINNLFNQEKVVLAQFMPQALVKSMLSNNANSFIQEALAWEKANSKHRIITLEDELYPVELANISSPPCVLFLAGNLDLLTKPKIAIVGSRHPSPQGLDNAKMFAAGICDNGYSVVSGMASGIDSAAHLGALSSNNPSSTIAVLGTGCDVIYPKSNFKLYHEIFNRGLILSEYPLKTQALAQNFPRRNRVIVGLSSACLVVESSIDGGSMISANLALEFGREVLAIPGSIHNPMARGCHKLIKAGAKLCETLQDIFEELPKTPTDLFVEELNPILKAMGYDPIHIELLALKLKIDLDELYGKILELEVDGRVINCGAGRYQQIFKANKL